MSADKPFTRENLDSNRAGIACPLRLPNRYEISLTQIYATCYYITYDFLRWEA